jgi:hypothetical protein
MMGFTMKSKFVWFLALAVALVVAGVALYSQAGSSKSTAMPGTVAFRLLMGGTDSEPSAWDGNVTVTGGAVASIEGWKFRGEDKTDGKTNWEFWSGRSLIPVGRAYAGQAPPIMENGIIITLASADPGARLSIQTKRGNFAFRVEDVPFGATQRFLEGGVVVDRVPHTAKLTDSPEDQDFPALAQSGDEVYLAYVEFVRGDRAQHRWGQMGENPPKDFSFVARPAGGDQVFLKIYSKSKKTWSAPIPVTGPKQDVMRAAVAVDGRKRVWVVWSANRNGNFDIYARAYSGGRFAREVRLTTDTGTDIYPVATTDSGGRVWVAWQGFRNGNLEVLAAAQSGDAFTRETVVSFSKASDWDPVIAAGAGGEVAIAWDTYDKGDYDVYFRRARWQGNAIRMDAPVPAAASAAFEARPSIAYDAQNRLWVAYEVSGEKWAKDNGAYDKEGIPIYRDHSVWVRCFQGAQAFDAPGDNLLAVLPKAAANQPNQAQKKGKKKTVPADEHDTAGAQAARMALNSFPRLAVDSSGVLYLAFRTRELPGRTAAGTVWAEHMVYFDGTRWVGPVFVPHADQWIENRPAMAPLAPGELLMVVAGDHRQAEMLRDRRGTQRRGDNAMNDVINADLYAAEMRVAAAVAPARPKSIPAPKVEAPEAGTAPERSQIAAMRAYKTKLAGEQAVLLRGEFHRHTDLSSDGTGDGPIIDAYRYMIDAASMDWGGCCDHDNGQGEYPWWIQQKLTDAYKLGDRYVSIFAYERSVSYPEGHRNAVFAQRGIRPLPRLPKTAEDSPATPAPDTQMLYEYVRKYDGIVASHTSGTDMGTDWRDNDPKIEPVVEIYQGCRQNYEMPGAPRANTAEYSIGGWRPLGFVSLALQKGYRLGFQSSSDHGSTHMSYCNLWVTKRTREGIMEAFKKRRVYGATDNILAEVRSGDHFMGEEFSTSEPPAISVKLVGSADFAKVHIIKDGAYAYSIEPRKRTVEFSWRDNAPTRGKTSYYYVRGEQTDGELVWASPMWITYK